MDTHLKYHHSGVSQRIKIIKLQDMGLLDEEPKQDGRESKKNQNPPGKD